jgi:hypothetical protein
MPTLNGKSYHFDELVKLRYDLAVDFYRQRARVLEVQTAARKGRFLEYWAYRTFENCPWMVSLALTLNPYWQFDRKLREYSNKVVPMLYPQDPVPVNRVRLGLSVYPQDIHATYRHTGTQEGTYRAWGGMDWIIVHYSRIDFDDTWPSLLGWQGAVQSFVKDTTWKSRNPRSAKIPFSKSAKEALGIQSQGEFEMWKPQFEASPRSLSWSSTSLQINDINNPPTVVKAVVTKVGTIEGPCASVDAVDVAATAASERVYALELLAKHADNLVAQCLPTRRTFNALYQLGELKDLPQTLRGTLAAWCEVETILGKQGFMKALISPKFWSLDKILAVRPSLAKAKVYLNPDKAFANAFLTFKFGWQSMYQAAVQLAKTPERAAKDINTLIRQNGKLATLSTGISMPVEDWTSFPAITPYILPGMLPDPTAPLSQSGTRKIRLRCVVNSGVQLPPLDVPNLRESLLPEKMGLVLRPSDIWNLIPWTWLVDWFAGYSQYIRLSEEIQRDEQIVNYALLTYHSILETTATRGGFDQMADTVVYSSHPWNGTSDLKTWKLQSSGVFTAAYQLRVSAASLANVKTTSGNGLNQSQMSILQALLTKYL